MVESGSELSAWQQSARRKPALPGEAAAGHRNRETHWIRMMSPQGRFLQVEN